MRRLNPCIVFRPPPSRAAPPGPLRRDHPCQVFPAPGRCGTPGGRSGWKNCMASTCSGAYGIRSFAQQIDRPWLHWVNLLQLLFGECGWRIPTACRHFFLCHCEDQGRPGPNHVTQRQREKTKKQWLDLIRGSERALQEECSEHDVHIKNRPHVRSQQVLRCVCFARVSCNAAGV